MPPKSPGLPPAVWRCHSTWPAWPCASRQRLDHAIEVLICPLQFAFPLLRMITHRFADPGEAAAIAFPPSLCEPRIDFALPPLHALCRASLDIRISSHGWAPAARRSPRRSIPEERCAEASARRWSRGHRQAAAGLARRAGAEWSAGEERERGLVLRGKAGNAENLPPRENIARSADFIEILARDDGVAACCDLLEHVPVD